MISEMIVKLAEMTRGARFASLQYRAKSSNELALHVVQLGFSYHNAVEKSLIEIGAILPELTGIDLVAGIEIQTSLQKTLDAHAQGKQNADYTKAGQYRPIIGGLNVNLNDSTFQLFGLTIQKTVIEPGTFKVVKSAPLTIAKNDIRRTLSIGKFREFALDSGVIERAKMAGETLTF